MLSPTVFRSSPPMPTVRLFGDHLYHGGLLFCDDSRKLAVYSEEWLAIWDLKTATQVAKIPGNNFRACIADDAAGELIALTTDSIFWIPIRPETRSAISPSRRAVLPDDQATALSGHPVRMSLGAHTLAICTSRHISSLSLHDMSWNASYAFPQHRNRQILSVRILPGLDPVVQIASVATQSSDCDRHLITAHDLRGQQTIAISNGDARSHAVRSAQYSAVALLFDLSERGAISLLDGSVTAWRLMRLDLARPDMHFFLSAGGEAIAGASSSTLAIWNSAGLLYQSPCDSTWFNVRLPDAGQLALITYSTPPDEGGLNVTGVINISTGRVVGHCADHLTGEPPFCFSGGQRYFATLITDSYCDLHPAKLPSGTVVLTELPSDAA